MGITKHPGGFKSTHKLVELCHITNDSLVLEIGSGVGKTSVYLAKKIGCKVKGLDLSEDMIKRANERIKDEKLEHLVDFVQADAQNIPFEDNLFDAVISESVTAFPEDKLKALTEYVRVTKPGGYVGINESTWLKEPPTEIREYLFKNAGGVKPETPEKWLELLNKAGLTDINNEIYKFKALDQFINELRVNGVKDSIKAWEKLFYSYIKDPVYRKAINEMAKDAKSTPKNLFGFFGYGLYSGRKK
jgi:arsenite methyltransferase